MLYEEIVGTLDSTHQFFPAKPIFVPVRQSRKGSETFRLKTDDQQFRRCGE